MSQQLRTDSGEKLDVTVKEYDKDRVVPKEVRALCLAPFTNLDINMQGDIALCNHIFENIGNIKDYDGSLLAAWRSEKMQALREKFQSYTFSQGCIHCKHQVKTGNLNNVFAKQHFDKIPPESLDPSYPNRLILRLNNTCNLACVMCDGYTSSKVRTWREKKPKQESAYNEIFFQDLREMLPHIKYIEFYGGEPFMVKEHLRVFDMLLEMNLDTKLYANTNLMALNSRTKNYLENLNFTHVAISMDAFHAEVHETIRIGIRNNIFMDNFRWMLDLAKRREISLNLNVTEHRKNWFDLPNVFRFAEQHELPIHINHCISPENITLYNLSIPEMEYVMEYFETEFKRYTSSYKKPRNRGQFLYLVNLLRGEINNKKKHPDQYHHSWSNEMEDGILRAPIPGLPPFDSDDRMSDEISRIHDIKFGQPGFRAKMLGEIRDNLNKPEFLEWTKSKSALEIFEKPKIIFTTYDWCVSGVNTCVTNVIRGLQNLKYNCEILVTPYFGQDIRKEPFPEDIPVKFLDVKTNDLWKTRWQRCAEYLENQAPCIVVPGYTNGYSGIAPMLSKHVGIAGVVHSDDPDHYDHVLRLGRFWNAIITVSDYLADAVCEMNPGWEPKIFTIPCPVDVPEEFEETAFDGVLRILYVGRVQQYQKRIFDTIEICRKLHQRRVKFHMTIVGEGPELEEVRARVKKHLDDGSITITGRISNQDSISLMKKNHVFLLNSEFEGMPVALMEAMAHGCVPVVSRIKSGVGQIVKSGKNGYMVDVGDINGFVDALEKLIETPEILNAMSRNAHSAMIASGFDIESTAHKYHEVFSYIVDHLTTTDYKRPEIYRPFARAGSVSVPPWLQPHPDEVIRLRWENEQLKRPNSLKKIVNYSKKIVKKILRKK